MGFDALFKLVVPKSGRQKVWSSNCRQRSAASQQAPHCRGRCSAMASSCTGHQRWPNDYFDAPGFFSLEAARCAEIISLREGENC